MIKQIGLLATLMLAGALLMLSIALYQVFRAPALIECAAPAPIETQASLTDARQDDAAPPEAGDGGKAAARPPASQLKQLLERVEEGGAELAATAPGHAMWGYAPDVPVSELDNAQNTQSAALLAVGEGYFSLYPAQMWSGRALAYDELRYGDRVALLDEQIALQLFGTTDAVDRRVNILGREYRVAGVARHRSAVGDPAACFAYVPLRAVARDGAQLSTLVLAAPPGAGAGGLQAVTDMTNLLLPGGTVHDSRRARQLALLVPRWALGALAAYLLGLAMVWLFALGGRWRARVADELRERYLVRMLPVLLLRALAWLAAFGALCALAWLLAGQLIQPVLAFPEWVPLVPVEPEEIQRTFWNLQWKNNLMIRCDTPLSLRLRFFGSLANTASSVGLIALVIALINRLRSR